MDNTKSSKPITILKPEPQVAIIKPIYCFCHCCLPQKK